ncbi:hypothetical protein TNCV_4420961 [Trichonephila clavipes]|nr:hypothetical protein TNCV_4420961 [Trichonephila clavipes]
MHERMSRSGGQSEARPPLLKSPSKLDTHLSTHCTVGLLKLTNKGNISVSRREVYRISRRDKMTINRRRHSREETSWNKLGTCATAVSEIFQLYFRHRHSMNLEQDVKHCAILEMKSWTIASIGFSRRKCIPKRQFRNMSLISV